MQRMAFPCCIARTDHCRQNHSSDVGFNSPCVVINDQSPLFSCQFTRLVFVVASLRKRAVAVQQRRSPHQTPRPTTPGAQSPSPPHSPPHPLIPRPTCPPHPPPPATSS